MRLSALCLGLFLSAEPLRAQDITQHMDQIGAGSYLILSAGDRTFVQVFRGPVGAYWVVDLIDGRDPNGPLVSREYRDALGQMVRVENPDGRQFRFAPHNCQHTQGTCQFTQTGPDGQTPMVRQTTATADGYSYQTFLFNGDGSLVLAESASVTLDAMGSPMAGRITAQDGSVMPIRQLQAVYR